jgi:hypothetical protein
MKKFLLLAVLVIAPFLLLHAQGKKKHKAKQPAHTVLERNPYWAGQVTTYSLAGEVEIRTARDTGIFYAEENDTNIFVVWYDLGGNISTYSMIGSKGLDACSGMCSSVTRDTFYLTGLFSDTVYVGGIRLVSNGSTDAFIACCDGKGNFLWAASSGGVGDDWGKRVYREGQTVVMVGLYSASEGDTLHFGKKKLIAWKDGINVFEPAYQRTAGTIVPDSRGLLSSD